MTTIEIEGRFFEIKKVTLDDLTNMENEIIRKQGFNLDNYYAKPSSIKCNIWIDWVNWAFSCVDEMIKNSICVTGANCSQFTIGILSASGVIKITKGHNYLYVLK